MVCCIGVVIDIFPPPPPPPCSGETPALYTVLPEKTASVGGAMMGSSHVYDMASAVPGAIKKVSLRVSLVCGVIFSCHRRLVHLTMALR